MRSRKREGQGLKPGRLSFANRTLEKTGYNVVLPLIVDKSIVRKLRVNRYLTDKRLGFREKRGG